MADLGRVVVVVVVVIVAFGATCLVFDIFGSRRIAAHTLQVWWTL